MAYIDDIDETSPNDDPDQVAGGAAQFRQFKTDVKGSFPSLGQAAVTKTADEINDLYTTTELNALLEALYPVGAIYIGTNPTGALPGVWTALEDVMLMGASTTYPAGSTGGNKNAVLIEHNHGGSTGGAGQHRHDVTLPRSGGDGGAGASEQFKDGTLTETFTNATSLVANHVHSITTSGTTNGVNANLPPYLAVTMWQRAS